MKATLSGKRVSEEVVRAVEQPEFTKTWYPHGHNTVLDVMEEAVHKEGLTIVKREYSLSGDQTNMFGVWQIGGVETKEARLAAGFRNSVSKQLAWAIGVGEQVFVCSNLIFKAEFIELRKHTSGLSKEVMIEMAQKAIHQIVAVQFQEMVAWHEELKDYSLTEECSAVLIVKAMKERCIRPSKFEKFIGLYESDRYASTLHGFHGAMTELIRDERLFQVEWRNRQMSKFIDEAKLLTLSVADENEN